MAQKSRATRLVTLALATGTLVAAAAGTAGAAPTAQTPYTNLKATASGSAIEITLNLPAALKPVFGTTKLTQRISFTDGVSSTKNLQSVVSNATLGKGNLPVVSDLLAKATKATLAKPTDAQSLLSVKNPAGLPIDLRAGSLSSLVSSPVTTAKGTLSQSSSELLGLTVGGGLGAPQLANVLKPITDTLDTALGTATGAVDTVADTVNTTVGTLTDTINGASGGATAPVSDTVKQAAETAVDTLQNTLDGLTATLSSLQAPSTNLVTLSKLTSSHAITKAGSSVTSKAQSGVAAIDVLNGLVTVEGLQSMAQATAGGVAGSANTKVVRPVLKVKVADALTFVIDQTGVNLTSTVGTLPAELQEAVNGALNSVAGLLNQVAGVSVEYGKVTQKASKDGTAAVAHVAGATLTVDPPLLHTVGLLGAEKFLQIRLVPADAEVLAVKQVAAPEAPFHPTKNPTGSMPKTGAELPIMVLTGAALLTGAAIVRRRRMVGSEI